MQARFPRAGMSRICLGAGRRWQGACQVHGGAGARDADVGEEPSGVRGFLIAL